MPTWTVADALALLSSLGASPWLVRHHELVVEAATLLTARLSRELKLSFDREEVLLGAALHDAGKILHPEEQREPGHRHEEAGQALLLSHGVPERLARFCVTHATWQAEDRTMEDFLVTLADKLWKGRREAELEARVLEVIARRSGREAWRIFDRLDAICEAVASDGPDRLARSQVE